MTTQPSRFREYLHSIGLTSPAEAKSYLAGEDLSHKVDDGYMDALNRRICEVLFRINKVVDRRVRRADLQGFCEHNIFRPYRIVGHEGLLPRLTSFEQRAEDALFSWLRGYAICRYFMPAVSRIFSVPHASISQIGNSDLKNFETFRRTPEVELEFNREGKWLRIVLQSGFQGINDIKEHKVRDARRLFEERGIKTICAHIDIYNGQMAFVPLDQIAENDAHFVTRHQMEWQSVLSIDQSYFKWALIDALPQLEELELGI